ncbi:MAG: hypothetical protein HOJ99_06720 [Porticoccaceae bacterium]|jgi:hypothetical protein|nr:hypothetical protein [Porticoccaceae bacterium]MBT5578170.1 hypothetical protein [Porticoccaceae bacterium]
MSKVTDIDSLFVEARNSEPYFNDQGFVSSVSAMLPAGRKVSVGQETAVTIAATVLGSAVAYPFFPIGDILALIPNSITITPIGLLAASSLVSGLIYWLAEHAAPNRM